MGKAITHYDPNVDSLGRKHIEITNFLKKNAPKVVRVCLDYPKGAPSVKWRSGATSDGNGWKISD